MSENPVVGPRASGFATGKDKKQAILVYIVDAAGRSPVTKQAARSQIGFSDRLLELCNTRNSGMVCYAGPDSRHALNLRIVNPKVGGY